MDHLSDTGVGALAERVGERVGALRRARSMTLAELAEQSELSRTIVSKIERGDGNPSIGTLWRISRTLRVSLGDLLGDPDRPRTRVTRAGEGVTVGDPSGMVARLLHGDGRERRTEVFGIELPVGAVRESAAHGPGVEELLIVTRGELAAGPEPLPGGSGALDQLGAGDALWFAADVPHRYETVGEAPCELLCWMLYPPTGA